MDRRGITLVAAVILLIFASIAIMGVTSFIVERLNLNQIRQFQTKAVYLAQAGAHNAVYWYRFRDINANGSFSLGQTDIDANNFFVLGGTAGDLLMVNTSLSSVGGAGNRFLQGLRIQNATDSNAITIDRMVVRWNNNQRLRQIVINGSIVFSSLPGLWTPANANIANFTLNTVPTIYPIDYIMFSGNMRGVTMSIQFVMTDGTSRTLTVYPASQNYSFTVKSTGKTTSSNIYRTIEADYNALTARITSYKEINTEMVP